MPRRRGNKTAAPATKKRRADSPEPSSPRPKTKKGRKSKEKSPSRENSESKDTSLAPRRSSRIATSSSSQQESDSKTYRRWPRQDPPIRYAEDIPESWNWHPNELDLDTNDVEGHIKRNRERIEDGILPQVFEMRLKLYEARKKERDDFLASEPADLQPMALIRIHTLRTMLEIMDRDGDADEQRPNVEAILKAYRKKKLTWSDEGKVTYWSKGKQVSEPREYSIEDLKEFNVKYNKGGKGFWVEGFSGPGPKRIMYSQSIVPMVTPNLWPTHLIWLELRSPGSSLSWKMEFLDDTGANTMNIWDTDVDMLVKSTNVDGTIPLNLGSSVIRTASDYILNKSLVVEARVAHEGLYTKWIAVEVTVRRRPPVRDPGFRLSGSWWRETLYVASFPDSQRKLHACDNYWEFLKMVPEVDPADVIPVSLPPTGANRPGAPPTNVFDCYI